MTFEQWEAEFKPLLGKSARWEGFQYLVKHLLSLDHPPVVLETGTLREPGNWKGDGQSTRLWSWIQEHKGGLAVSVDLDYRACALAQRECPNVQVICADSVSFLRGWQPFSIDLLYLDSLGCDIASVNDASLWAIHQLAELTAIWHKLPSGCIVASDDQSPMDGGKPALTKRFFKMLGVAPEIDGYIVAWKKP